jgi:hypothetical protein
MKADKSIIDQLLQRVKLLDSKSLLKPMSLQELHDSTCEFIEMVFKDTGSAPTLWVISNDTSILWIETDWHSGIEKSVITKVMAMFLEAVEATAYSFISEAWVVNSEIFPADQREELTQRAMEGGLENFPAKYRDDICMISSFDASGEAKMTQYKVTITQRRNALNLLGPRMDIDTTPLKMEGRLWNLLKKA